MPDTTAPRILKVLDLSTSHLPYPAVEAIEQDTFLPKPVMTGVYGFLFHVPDADDRRHHFDQTPETGAAIRACIEYAAGQGCQYILFDRDADTVDALPVFDW